MTHSNGLVDIPSSHSHEQFEFDRKFHNPFERFQERFGKFHNPFARFDKPFGKFHKQLERFRKPFGKFHEPFERLPCPFGILNTVEPRYNDH